MSEAKYGETITGRVISNRWLEEHEARIAKLEKPWHGLSDDEIHEQIENASIPQYQGMDVTATNLSEFARAIEAKLKDKNICTQG